MAEAIRIGDITVHRTVEQETPFLPALEIVPALTPARLAENSSPPAPGAQTPPKKPVAAVAPAAKPLAAPPKPAMPVAVAPKLPERKPTAKTAMTKAPCALV
jgi:hypothetical protein